MLSCWNETFCHVLYDLNEKFVIKHHAYIVHMMQDEKFLNSLTNVISKQLGA